MRGSCLCGAVRWETDAAPRAPIACHCGACRKQSGHYWVASQVPLSAMRIEGEPRWFAASPAARRGFCPVCGSFLFWAPAGRDALSFSMGSIDGPTGLSVAEHIHAAEKGDHYAIPAGEPAQPGWA